MSQKINFLENDDVRIISKIIDTHGVMAAHSLSIKDLVNLCGGVPSPDIEQLEISVSSPGTDVLEIRLSTKLYDLIRVIDLGLKIINNTYMYVDRSRRGIGTSLFCNQVKEARIRQFRVLYTTAMGRESGPGWSGYYCWGRLGYQMIKEDKLEFLELVSSFGRKEKDLNEMLQTEDGRVFWLAFGFTWSGEFLLEEQSASMQQLRTYLAKKQLDHGI